MAITNTEEMLMESLAHIGCQNEVVLILLIGVMNTKAFSSTISKSRYNVIFYYLSTFILFVFFYSERTVSCVFNSVVVVDPLILETWRLRDHSCSYETLDGSEERVGAGAVNLFCDLFEGLSRLHRVDNLSRIFTYRSFLTIIWGFWPVINLCERTFIVFRRNYIVFLY